MKLQLSCTKSYRDIPFAHRQPAHDGHCRFIHGHNWGFEFTFTAPVLDQCGFVVDFGKLGYVKEYLQSNFDHALVLNETDPLLSCPEFRKVMEVFEITNIVTVPDCSSEGLAQYLLEHVNQLVQVHTDGRVAVSKVTVYEDEKNSATAEAV